MWAGITPGQEAAAEIKQGQIADEDVKLEDLLVCTFGILELVNCQRLRRIARCVLIDSTCCICRAVCLFWKNAMQLMLRS